MSDFFKIYDAVIAGLDKSANTDKLFFGQRWAMAQCRGNLGLAMSTEGASIAPMLENISEGLPLAEISPAIKSWNFREASMAMAACNAYYNSTERIKALHCSEPYENYCTAGLNLSGAVIGLVGHLSVTDEMAAKAEKIYILEKSPKPGDYPDSACDYILPQCDIVIITGSAFVNKTLPHLLELSKNAQTTILVGPTVPMCAELLNYGIDRLSGMAVDRKKDMLDYIISGKCGNPYQYGKCFMLKK